MGKKTRKYLLRLDKNLTKFLVISFIIYLILDQIYYLVDDYVNHIVNNIDSKNYTKILQEQEKKLEDVNEKLKISGDKRVIVRVVGGCITVVMFAITIYNIINPKGY